MLLGDFNLTTSNKYFANFMTFSNLESLLNNRNCFQCEKPRYIDLISINMEL